MAKGGRPVSRQSPNKGQGKARGYTLRGKNDKINYVGITKDPARRATEHKADGKQGKMNVETPPMPRSDARNWEGNRLQTYRRSHDGKNPPQNKNKNGGWKS